MARRNPAITSVKFRAILLHAIILMLMDDARDLDATGLEVDDEKHKIAKSKERALDS